MLIEIMIPEIARMTREQIAKRIATSMLVGAAFDGLLGVIQEKNPAKEGAKGALVGGVGQAASLATKELLHSSDKISMTAGVLASVAARYALGYIEHKNDPDDENQEEIEG